MRGAGGTVIEDAALVTDALLKGPVHPQPGGTQIVGRPASTASATRAAVSRSQMCAASRVCTGCHHKASGSGTAS
jgi:hypothetical protein